MDDFKNWAEFEVSTGYNAAATSIVLSSDPGSACPTAPANAVWWNSTDHHRPQDDDNREIVRMTARTGATLTVTRAQEGTSATTKNTASKTYKMAFGPTAKTMATDIPALVATPATNARFRDGNLEVYNSAQSTWHPITIIGAAGAEQILVGDGNTNP